MPHKMQLMLVYISVSQPFSAHVPLIRKKTFHVPLRKMTEGILYHFH